MAEFEDILGLLETKAPPAKRQRTSKRKGKKKAPGPNWYGRPGQRLTKAIWNELPDEVKRAQKAKMRAGTDRRKQQRQMMIQDFVGSVGPRKTSNRAAKALKGVARHKATKALYGGAALKHLNGYRGLPTRRHLESDYPSALLAIQAYNSMHPIKSATGCAAASQANRVVRRAISRAKPRAAPTARQLAARARFAAASRAASAAGMSLAEYLRQ